MDVVFLIGRVLFALIFVNSGVMAHFVQRKSSVEYARAKGSPMPEFGVPFTGVLAVAGGLMVALGIWGDLGALLIVAFLLLITPIMHAFWKIDEPMERINQLSHFMKNASMLGGALVVFYVFKEFGDDALTLTDSLF